MAAPESPLVSRPREGVFPPVMGDALVGAPAGPTGGDGAGRRRPARLAAALRAGGR